MHPYMLRHITAMLDAGVDLCDVLETTTMLGVSAVLVFLGVALRAAAHAAFHEHIFTRWSHAASGAGGRLLLAALPHPA
ncbi:MAG TPA: hypothetical protein VFE45_17970 [Coriobacteriia bacterium]|nr:hypothetical protein [Coriobacteriia bacterium]